LIELINFKVKLHLIHLIFLTNIIVLWMTLLQVDYKSKRLWLCFYFIYVFIFLCYWSWN